MPTHWRVWSPDLSLTLTQGAPRVGPRTVVVLEGIEDWYTLHRPHSSLGYRSPAVHETALAA